MSDFVRLEVSKDVRLKTFSKEINDE